MTYFVTGLPRSRTAWMAAFLTGDVVCHHELLNECHSKEEFRERMEGCGNSDCGLPLTPFQEWWDAPTLIIERPIEDVVESCRGICEPDVVECFASYLSEVRGMRVAFDQLDERMPEICAYLRVPYDIGRHRLFKKMNIQLSEIRGDVESLAVWLR